MIPKYTQLVKDLHVLLRHLYAAGTEKLPTEAELCDQYHVSRQTVRHALAELEAEGLIEKRRGSGSYLAGPFLLSNRRIAIVLPGSDEYTYPALLRGLTERFRQENYSVSVFCSENSVQTERKILSGFLTDPPAGLVLEPSRSAYPECNRDLRNQLSAMKIPTVVLNGWQQKDYICVCSDDAGGARQLVSYLSGKGHKRITGLFRSDDAAGIRRYMGMVDALFQFGLPFDEAAVGWYFTEDLQRIRSGENTALFRFVHHMGDCSAVICQSDEIASDLIRVLQLQHVSVPDRISVVSFDNSYYCETGPVFLTSLGHEQKAAAQCAAAQLLAALSGRRTHNVTLPWHLYERQSG